VNGKDQVAQNSKSDEEKGHINLGVLTRLPGQKNKKGLGKEAEGLEESPSAGRRSAKGRSVTDSGKEHCPHFGVRGKRL